MKLIALLCLLLVPASLLGNRADPSSMTPNSPFDDYGNICWENEQARLDNFAIQLQNQPTATGEIMVYAGRLSCVDEAKYRGNRGRDYLMKKRGVPSHQIIVKDGGFQQDVRTMLIIVPKGARSYDYPTSLPKDKASIKRCVGKVFAKVLCLNKQ